MFQFISGRFTYAEKIFPIVIPLARQWHPETIASFNQLLINHKHTPDCNFWYVLMCVMYVRCHRSYTLNKNFLIALYTVSNIPIFPYALYYTTSHQTISHATLLILEVAINYMVVQNKWYLVSDLSSDGTIYRIVSNIAIVRSYHGISISR